MLLRRASVAVLRAVRGSTCHAAAAAPSSTAWRWQPSVVSFSTTVPSLQQAAASSSETAAPSYTLTDVSADADLDVGEVSKQSIETAWFTKRNIQGSVKKLNLMARQIRGMAVTEAIAQMAFTPKERGAVFRMVLKSAAANAEFYHGWHIDELAVHEAVVSKNRQLKKPHYKAKGRMGIARRRFSQLTVTVRRMSAEEAEAKLRAFPEPDADYTHDARNY